MAVPLIAEGLPLHAEALLLQLKALLLALKALLLPFRDEMGKNGYFFLRSVGVLALASVAPEVRPITGEQARSPF
jgi:hypothetical protein